MPDLDLNPSSQISVLGTIDMGNDGHQIILAMLALVDTGSYPLDLFEFSEPEALTGQAAVVDTVIDSGGNRVAVLRNTKIFLTPKAVSGFYGPKVIYYNRIHGSALPSITIPRGTATTVLELLPAYNQITGLGIHSHDILDGPLLPANPQNQVLVTLTFKPTSLIFYDSTELIAEDYVFGGIMPNYPAEGTVFQYYCSGVNRYKLVADGEGGVDNILHETNSLLCPVNPTPPVTGTVFFSYCNGRDLMRVTANGTGGITNTLFEASSLSCPVNPPPTPANTVYGEYCRGTTLYKMYADGEGGTYELPFEYNSATCPACPVVPVVPERGTVLAEYCRGTTLTRLIYDDSLGGANQTYEQGYEENSATCPMYPPPIIEGTAFFDFCNGGNKMTAQADGLGGVNTVIAEADSPDCVSGAVGIINLIAGDPTLIQSDRVAYEQITGGGLLRLVDVDAQQVFVDGDLYISQENSGQFTGKYLKATGSISIDSVAISLTAVECAGTLSVQGCSGRIERIYVPAGGVVDIDYYDGQGDVIFQGVEVGRIDATAATVRLRNAVVNVIHFTSGSLFTQGHTQIAKLYGEGDNLNLMISHQTEVDVLEIAKGNVSVGQSATVDTSLYIGEGTLTWTSDATVGAARLAVGGRGNAAESIIDYQGVLTDVQLFSYGGQGCGITLGYPAAGSIFAETNGQVLIGAFVSCEVRCSLVVLTNAAYGTVTGQTESILDNTGGTGAGTPSLLNNLPYMPGPASGDVLVLPPAEIFEDSLIYGLTAINNEDLTNVSEHIRNFVNRPELQQYSDYGVSNYIYNENTGRTFSTRPITYVEMQEAANVHAVTAAGPMHWFRIVVKDAESFVTIDSNESDLTTRMFLYDSAGNAMDVGAYYEEYLPRGVYYLLVGTGNVDGGDKYMAVTDSLVPYTGKTVTVNIEPVVIPPAEYGTLTWADATKGSEVILSQDFKTARTRNTKSVRGSNSHSTGISYVELHIEDLSPAQTFYAGLVIADGSFNGEIYSDNTAYLWWPAGNSIDSYGGGTDTGTLPAGGLAIGDVIRLEINHDTGAVDFWKHTTFLGRVVFSPLAGIPVTLMQASPSSNQAELRIRIASNAAEQMYPPINGVRWDELPYVGWSGGITTYTVATGGVVTQDGAFNVHELESIEDFTVVSLGSVNTFETLRVGGGGGGGGYFGGGSAGGGVIHLLTESLSVGVHTATVGGGGLSRGPDGVGNPRNGLNGGNTVFNGLTAFGGGVGAIGGASSGYPPTSGGSGGGGGSGPYYQAAANGTLGQGREGGTANYHGSAYNSGGGGGANGPGVAAAADRRGDGGDGYPCSITGTLRYYGAGGGAGGGSLAGGVGGLSGTNGTERSDGGRGNPSNGSPITSPQDGVDGLGSGGGGGARTVGNTSSRGGNGTVIVRYMARPL